MLQGQGFLNSPAVGGVHRDATNQIQKGFDAYFKVLTNNIAVLEGYQKYLSQSKSRLHAIQDVLKAFDIPNDAHPQLIQAGQIFKTFYQETTSLKTDLKQKYITQCIKKIKQATDFKLRVQVELKKIFEEIFKLYQKVRRSVKKPSLYVSCNNALTDGFESLNTYLSYFNNLDAQEKELNNIVKEVHESILDFRSFYEKLQIECNTEAYEKFLRNDPTHDYLQEKLQVQPSGSTNDGSTIKANVLYKQIKQYISLFRVPEFDPITIYQFPEVFEPLDTESANTELRLLSSYNPGTTSSIVITAQDTHTPPTTLQLTPPDTFGSEDFGEMKNLNDLQSRLGSPDRPAKSPNRQTMYHKSSNHSNNASTSNTGGVNFGTQKGAGRQKVICRAKTDNYVDPFSTDYEIHLKKDREVEIIDGSLMNYWYVKKINKADKKVAKQGYAKASCLEPVWMSGKRSKSIMIDPSDRK